MILPSRAAVGGVPVTESVGDDVSANGDGDDDDTDDEDTDEDDDDDDDDDDDVDDNGPSSVWG